jgi:hypothetical protein
MFTSRHFVFFSEYGQVDRVWKPSNRNYKSWYEYIQLKIIHFFMIVDEEVNIQKLLNYILCFMTDFSRFHVFMAQLVESRIYQTR